MAFTIHEFERLIGDYHGVESWEIEIAEMDLVVTVVRAKRGFDKAMFAGYLREFLPASVGLQVRLAKFPFPRDTAKDNLRQQLRRLRGNP